MTVVAIGVAIGVAVGCSGTGSGAVRLAPHSVALQSVGVRRDMLSHPKQTTAARSPPSVFQPEGSHDS